MADDIQICPDYLETNTRYSCQRQVVVPTACLRDTIGHTLAMTEMFPSVRSITGPLYKYILHPREFAKSVPLQLCAL